MSDFMDNGLSNFNTFSLVILSNKPICPAKIGMEGGKGAYGRDEEPPLQR
jgi:hypothetical protein